MSGEDKPESMLAPEVRQLLAETIDAKLEQALKEGNHELASELQRARKLVLRGCWSVRRANPYLEFVGECVAMSKPHGGKLTLEETQRLMRECAAKWNALPENEKARYRTLAGELGIYDYL